MKYIKILKSNLPVKTTQILVVELHKIAISKIVLCFIVIILPRKQLLALSIKIFKNIYLKINSNKIFKVAYIKQTNWPSPYKNIEVKMVLFYFLQQNTRIKLGYISTKC